MDQGTFPLDQRASPGDRRTRGPANQETKGLRGPLDSKTGCVVLILHSLYLLIQMPIFLAFLSQIPQTWSWSLHVSFIAKWLIVEEGSHIILNRCIRGLQTYESTTLEVAFPSLVFPAHTTERV